MTALRRIAATLAQADRYDVLITLGFGCAFCMALLAGVL